MAVAAVVIGRPEEAGSVLSVDWAVSVAAPGDAAAAADSVAALVAVLAEAGASAVEGRADHGKRNYNEEKESSAK